MTEIILFGDFLLYLTSSRLHPELHTIIYLDLDNIDTLLHSVVSKKNVTY